jgi:hypothetical protein
LGIDQRQGIGAILLNDGGESMEIKDILTIDISEDIKNVIDLEDFSDVEIKAEIEKYTVTDGLAREYEKFVNTFTSSIVETGVWISGFYGSGKSYFGKILGLLLSNRKVVGTHARDRILQRFVGISNEALVKNSLSKLNTLQCRVVFLDVAKQDTSKGLAFTLFRNFLRSLELPENEHGFLLFQLMMNDENVNVHDFVAQRTDKKWNKLKSKMIEYSKFAKTLYLDSGNNENDYDHLMETIRRDIDQFSASRLKEELNNYLICEKDERIIFLFDEASEALNQKKFSLLDLEGISESLSALGGKVWTIAIAQEKLDDVIKNSNVDKSQLTKVTDRFKTKIHLEATEVDVIIRDRLLKKKEGTLGILETHFTENQGRISDHTALDATGIIKTDSLESYITYYPFYQQHFNLMQNFLFGTKGFASTKVAARGMIITTFDILKREMQNEKLFEVVSGWQITKQAQPQPHVRLVSRYDNAEKILKETGAKISGRRLLETIHFLSEAEVVPTTLPNIVKSFIKDPEDFQKFHGDIQNALGDLVDGKILLLSTNTYRITSDIEQRLMEEMNLFTVQGFVKKKIIVDEYKNSRFLKSLSRVTDDVTAYDFYITTDNDDELTKPQIKQLKLRVKSHYSISDDRASDIESLKIQHQNDKDLIYLIPENESFNEIDALIQDIKRISDLEDKYNNPNSDEAPIVRSFSTTKSEKEMRLKDLVEQSLHNATAICLFDTYQLNNENWLSTIQSLQRKVIQNLYSKRLESQLSDTIAPRVIGENNAERLHSYFAGKDFQFFDRKGNFIGENLRVSEEILFKIRNTFVDGATLQKDLELPPTGFPFGTVNSSVAALMRANRIIAKYNGVDLFSWRDEGVKAIFSTASKFRRASFKGIAESLTPKQKDELVTMLRGLPCEDELKIKIDWNITGIVLVQSMTELAKRFCEKVGYMRSQTKDFSTLFPDIEDQLEALSGHTGAVNEGNYIRKAKSVLANKDAYVTSIKSIENVDKFIQKKIPNVTKWNSFISDVDDELKKAALRDKEISKLIEEFQSLYTKGVLNNYGKIQKTSQKVKDKYFALMQEATKEMAGKYAILKKEADEVIEKISSLPPRINDTTLEEVKKISQYSSQRIVPGVDVDYDVKDKNSRFTYSEILSFIELHNAKKGELDFQKASIIIETPPKRIPDEPGSEPPKRVFHSKIPALKMKVMVYKDWLKKELQKLAGASDDDEIEIINDDSE